MQYLYGYVRTIAHVTFQRVCSPDNLEAEEKKIKVLK